ncbi:MAG: transcriptional antiterminator NusG [Methanobacteriota archaeon]|jgi:transcriptional antiterminator NusG|uniref:Transcription elongation factor Spt5 n=1 Tax=Halorutilus salinus TaxID=2487751 RepID=A0A9Q4C559_9EURY|nr:transcription elongation factor Spt5 [Halorutilus salinus]MCX2818491.1 transcription elongation factor Spt5 [Halorutilus salinus]
MGIYAVKTTASQETTVADMLADRDNPGVLSALVPSDVTAYVLVEAEDENAVDRAIDRIPHAHSMVEGQTSMQEVEHFLTPKPSVSGVNEGDVVEIISGPFKGEKARIKRIDESSEEVTVELHESTVPIPVTVRGDHIRVLDSEER